MKENLEKISTKKIQEPILDFNNPEITEEPFVENNIPSINDPAWHQYAMSHFTVDELVDGCPSTDGLRRVANLLIGEIIDTKLKVHQVPDSTNNYRATISVEMVFNTATGQIRFSDIADCNLQNADREYAKFPTAMAMTRAEGRCLRKALRLRKIIAIEEKANETTVVNEPKINAESLPDRITQTQIAGIKLLSARAGISYDKFLADKKIANIESITFSEAAELCSVLSEYFNSPNNVPEGIKQ